jgi:hypothetical protein
MFKSALAVVTISLFIPNFAAARGGGKQGNPACAPIRAACEKAGFQGRGKGGSANQAGNQGSLRDCMQKWSGGGSIPGMTIKSTDASGKECAAHLAKMKERGGKRGRPGGQMNAQGGPGGRRGGPGAMGMGRSAPGTGRPSPLLNSRPPAPMNSAPAVLPTQPAKPSATPVPK